METQGCNGTLLDFQHDRQHPSIAARRKSRWQALSNGCVCSKGEYKRRLRNTEVHCKRSPGVQSQTHS